ncbi:hypothetical protein JWJ88_14430 [Paracoccus methylovorus]|uniref:ATP-grasp domain-containing protein n=2 Tax=Paracoccus TaxID=265 RepID=A0ABX7JPE6_9RHOB|nr:MULTISPECIES: hypothetical protein [Paracoccus]QRZ15539.1 hypothetical protein JWJ88_14430 [Paracoccus methylovorus]
MFRGLIAVRALFHSGVFKWGVVVTSILFGMKADWREALQHGAQAIGMKSQMANLRHADLSGFDAVIPLTLWDRDILDQRRANGEKFNALFPGVEAKESCDDKLRFNWLMARVGFGSYVPTVLSDIDLISPDKPVIIKRRQDEWGKQSRIAFAQVGSPLLYNPAEEFLQEYIPGTVELSAHLLLRQGRIVFARTAKFDMPDIPHVKGINTGYNKLEWQEGSEHLDLFDDILNAIGFHDGTCCIDFREVDGKPRIFEINPRLGGSLTGNVGDYLLRYLAEATSDQPVRAPLSTELRVAA